VVFLAVRVYFFITTVSRQSIITEGVPNRSWIDLYIPFMSMLQLIFYLGWLKARTFLAIEKNSWKNQSQRILL
jgi:hypothetical protein